jgi:hypothetical protein
MLLELAAAKKWKPRWYYILINKTTNKKYIGQTTRKCMDSYCGSGVYWKKHCQKHGGYNRTNIEVLNQVWVEDIEKAEHWLKEIKETNKDYFLFKNKEWANLIEETTFDSPFYSIPKEQKLLYCKKGGMAIKEKGLLKQYGKKQGKINVETGHMLNIQKLGASLGGKITGAKNIKAAHNLKNAKENCKLGGLKACEIKHKNKDEVTGKSIFAVAMGKKSKETKTLLSAFCKENNISKPGKNYVNVDRNLFNLWRALNASGVNSCESSISSNQRGCTKLW